MDPTSEMKHFLHIVVDQSQMKRILNQLSNFVNQHISATSPYKARTEEEESMAPKQRKPPPKNGRRTDLDDPPPPEEREAFEIPGRISKKENEEDVEGSPPVSPYLAKKYGTEAPPSENSLESSEDGNEDDQVEVDTDEESAPKSKKQAEKLLKGINKGSGSGLVASVQLTLDGKPVAKQGTNAKNKKPTTVASKKVSTSKDKGRDSTKSNAPAKGNEVITKRPVGGKQKADTDPSEGYDDASPMASTSIASSAPLTSSALRLVIGGYQDERSITGKPDKKRNSEVGSKEGGNEG